MFAVPGTRGGEEAEACASAERPPAPPARRARGVVETWTWIAVLTGGWCASRSPGPAARPVEGPPAPQEQVLHTVVTPPESLANTNQVARGVTPKTQKNIFSDNSAIIRIGAADWQLTVHGEEHYFALTRTTVGCTTSPHMLTVADFITMHYSRALESNSGDLDITCNGADLAACQPEAVCSIGKGERLRRVSVVIDLARAYVRCPRVRVGRSAARVRQADEEGVSGASRHVAGAACRAGSVFELVAALALNELNLVLP